MHAIVRSYAGEGAPQLFDLIERRQDEVRELIGGVPGFVSYVAARTGGGGVTVTVCQDRDGANESSRRAAAWVKENSAAAVDPPVISEGDVFLQFGS